MLRLCPLTLHFRAIRSGQYDLKSLNPLKYGFLQPLQRSGIHLAGPKPDAYRQYNSEELRKSLKGQIFVA